MKSTSRPVDFLERAKHLTEIHAAPRELWRDLAQRMLDEGCSASETREKVAAVLGDGINALDADDADEDWDAEDDTPSEAAILNGSR